MGLFVGAGGTVVILTFSVFDAAVAVLLNFNQILFRWTNQFRAFLFSVQMLISLSNLISLVSKSMRSIPSFTLQSSLAFLKQF